jgi:hypothetical protein
MRTVHRVLNVLDMDFRQPGQLLLFELQQGTSGDDLHGRRQAFMRVIVASLICIKMATRSP